VSRRWVYPAGGATFDLLGKIARRTTLWFSRD